ncbi:helix-turn-helix domain-containing protein [Streptomyces sp. H27-D2]|uniref:helix-turn-helix domain-containing protein n=1 Tax=Streptomyces sp. H27-D2 TaxID=3046304 RepID=UPI002DB7FD2C|nr:helix-turn-helix transcriptional regulator [Streptomyces sp. H27-D2]MEC4018378.1 helix-turn-helix transcriptional regulator [Streptomyces sp. H27-D2]
MTLDPEQLGKSKADLAEKLRELRKRAGLTGDRLAKRCNMSQSTISKIETGRKTPKLIDVERILRALDASPDAIAEVAALARMANTEWQDIRTSWRRGLDKRQTELASLEVTARDMRYFLPSMITGLLATPEYARASLDYSPGDISKTLAKKLDRQAVLYDRSRTFTFILTEQAVKWSVIPPAAMSVQIDHLVSVSRLPNVRLGVIPNGTRISRGPMNTFTVYDDRLATVETFTGRIVFQDYRDVAEHLALFALYESRATFGETCREHLSRWAEMYRRGL